MDLVGEDVHVREIGYSRTKCGFAFMHLECKGARYLVHVDPFPCICKGVRE
jgi:hypothetical protein